MTARTPLGDPVLINQNQLDRNGVALIAMIDAPSRDHIFLRAIEHLEGGTRSPPSDAILIADAGSASAFFKWWYDTAADRPFAERVIRMGGALFAGQIEAQLRNPDDMIRIEMLRTVLQSQGKVKVASSALDSLLSDPSPDVQLLAIDVIANDPIRTPLSAKAARVALAKVGDDVASCLGLRLSERTWSAPEAQSAAWRLLQSMSTNPMNQIKHTGTSSLYVAPVQCDLQFVLRVLLPSGEAGRKEVTTRLADFVATHPSMTPRLANEVERDPALSTQWPGMFLPYWRGEADRYLAQGRDFPIGAVFPLYRSAAAALERSRLAADAEQLFKVATHHAPFEGDLLSRAIDALSRAGVLQANSASVATALADFSARSPDPGFQTQPFKALAAHVDDLAHDSDTVARLWVVISWLRTHAPDVANEMSAAINERNDQLARALINRFPAFGAIPEPEACESKAFARQKEAFYLAYSRQDFLGAKSLLDPILSCQNAPRNDMAVTLHHLGNDEGCLAVLMPLLELAKTPDARMPTAPRPYWDRQRRLARQTRTNLRLCNYPGVLPG